jgi:hypothetical protein
MIVRQVLVCGLLLTAAAAGVQAGEGKKSAASAPPQASAPALFCLGLPDGSPLEFGLVKETWPAYAKVYPKPVVFTVGQSPLSAWPYIHPSTHDAWAGATSHTFTVRFALSAPPVAPQFLVLGLLAILEPSHLTIALNGKAVADQRLPNESINVDLAFHPAGRTDPLPLVFPVPADALVTGTNELTITLRDGSWMIYDYVRLGSDRKPPVLSTASNLLDAARRGPLAGVTDVVFATRKPGHDGHWYANFGYYAEDFGKTADGDGRKLYATGGRLCRLNLATGVLTNLLDDPLGGVRDPQVSYDAKKILFSYRKGGTENYHLYEIAAGPSTSLGASGTGLTQLTDGPWDDLEPTYTADGGIVFVSSRGKRWVNCWLTQVAILYRCDADGRNIRPLSANIEHDNTPWPLPDGRLLFTRWEYVDRSQVHYHHLWTANPDGTAQQVYYGNLRPGAVYIDSKPVPGSRRVVTIDSPGHGRSDHQGTVALIDPGAGPDEAGAVRAISRGGDFRDPWALSENCILAARGASLVLLDGGGREQVLFQLPPELAGQWLHEPRPLAPRAREFPLVSRVKTDQPNGRLMLANVNEGRNMAGVKPGTIKKLLVLESLPKPINYTGGMDPLTYGGSFTLERMLGTVPVEADGSAYFEVPALRSVFFVALDEKDLAVKRMQSFTSVQPGETLSCVGCHEQRTRTTIPASFGTANARPPSKIEPVAGVPEVFDYPRDIQPILDALCVDCHGPDKTAAGGPRAGRLLLTGDRGPMFSHSYYMMTIARLFSDGRNRPQSNYAPYTLGSSASKILKMLDGSHYKVQATEAQKKMLRCWIEVGAPYPGTYAALGTGMIGGYAENQPVGTDGDWPTTKAGAEVIARRCAGCHEQPARLLPRSLSDERGVSFWIPDWNDPRLNTSRHIVFNLTRPEKSMVLLAPLAQAAGGWGACPTNVFADKNDPDYQKLLAMCVAGKEHLDKIKRFDMPGFRPRVEYLRELRRYGVLPASFDLAKDPADAYDLDRRYWESLWYRPSK